MKAAVIGKNGFIGSALTKKLESKGWTVSSYPSKLCDIIFHFGSPTHLEFEQNVEYHTKEIIDSFTYLLPYCAQHNIKFVFPSSALIYEKLSPFARLKNVLELMPLIYDVDYLCLRIFPVYGEGERNKVNKTPIYQFCQTMKEGKRPVIYGDGNQRRDFIYIDDVIDNMLYFIERGRRGSFDLGGGNPKSFNQIVKEVNKALGKNIKPKYIKAPLGYSKGIYSRKPVVTRVNLSEGINRILASL